MNIEIIRSCNFHITFDNEVTVSILIGGGSYSDNHNDINLMGHESEKRRLSSSTAEIAAWKRDGQWITSQLRPDAKSDVLGWQDTNQILAFLNKASKYKEA